MKLFRKKLLENYLEKKYYIKQKMCENIPSLEVVEAVIV